MSALPRLAVGAVQPEADTNFLVWALLDFFRSQEIDVQHFLSRACFCSRKGAFGSQSSGSRHLDSWLMDRDRARSSFWRGMQEADFALVEGRFASAYRAHDRDAELARTSDCGGCRPASWGGSLDTLCDWLDLPRIAVFNVQLSDSCHSVLRRGQYDAVLLDHVRDDRDFFTWKTNLEALYGLPVIGGMPIASELRARVASEPRCESLLSRAGGELARELSRWTNAQRLMEFACRRDFAWCELPPEDRHADRSPIRVAMAYDEAFNCYFPDSIDALEALGAKLIDFSPLKDEALPADVDVVYFGCGHPERFAERLSANQCMMQALRDYVRRGGRLYAEGGGFAYLCQSIHTDSAAPVPMVGVFPAEAHWNAQPAPPRPVEVTMTRRAWLGEPGTQLRGYRNERWSITPQSPQLAVLGEVGHEHDLLTNYQAIGSRLHLHFAASPHFLQSFLHPHHLTTSWRH
jgi:cobyrinic acid a,c-diamide synthase